MVELQHYEAAMGSLSHGGHERGKRGDGDLTRSRILEAAGQLAAECGYANMTSNRSVKGRM